MTFCLNNDLAQSQVGPFQSQSAPHATYTTLFLIRSEYVDGEPVFREDTLLLAQCNGRY